jgi:exosortase/archaeosortase family protein
MRKLNINLNVNLLRLLPFILYTAWTGTAYWAVHHVMRLASNVQISNADHFLIICPVLMVFFLTIFEWRGGDYKIKKCLGPLVLSFMFLGGAALSLLALWIKFDTIYFVPFNFLFAAFTVSSLFMFFPRYFLKKHVKGLSLFGAFYAVGLAVLLGAQFFWTEIAAVILSALQFGFGYISPVLQVMPEMGVVAMYDFNVFIGLPCIGITSFLLFWAFYGGYGASEWGKRSLNVTNFAILFAVGLMLLFLLNILRIGLLVYIGATYSPEFAMNAFHEFAGFAIFILFTFPYFLVTRRWIVQRQRTIPLPG